MRFASWIQLFLLPVHNTDGAEWKRGSMILSGYCGEVKSVCLPAFPYIVLVPPFVIQEIRKMDNFTALFDV
jgi:hypothetical protein